MAQRAPVLRDNQGRWLYDSQNQITPQVVVLNEEMQQRKEQVQAARAAEER